MEFPAYVTAFLQTHKRIQCIADGMCLTAMAGVLYLVYLKNDNTHLALSILVLLVWLLALCLMDVVMMWRLRKTAPDLFTPPSDEYKRARRRNTVVEVMLLLFSIVFPLALLLIAERKRRFQRQYPPASADLRHITQTMQTRTNWHMTAFLCGFCACVGLVMLSAMYESVGHSKYDALCHGAKDIAVAAQTQLTAWEEEDIPYQPQTICYQVGDAIAEGSLLESIVHTYPYSQEYNFAVVFDDAGNLAYVLCAYFPLDARNLELPTHEEMYAISSNPFRKQALIGFYIPITQTQ